MQFNSWCLTSSFVFKNENFPAATVSAFFFFLACFIGIKMSFSHIFQHAWDTHVHVPMCFRFQELRGSRNFATMSSLGTKSSYAVLTKQCSVQFLMHQRLALHFIPTLISHIFSTLSLTSSKEDSRSSFILKFP